MYPEPDVDLRTEFFKSDAWELTKLFFHTVHGFICSDHLTALLSWIFF